MEDDVLETAMSAKAAEMSGVNRTLSGVRNPPTGTFTELVAVGVVKPMGAVDGVVCVPGTGWPKNLATPKPTITSVDARKIF